MSTTHAAPKAADPIRGRLTVAAGLVFGPLLLWAAFETTNRTRHGTWGTDGFDGPYVALILMGLAAAGAFSAATLVWGALAVITRWWPQARTVGSWVALAAAAAWFAYLMVYLWPAAVGAAATGTAAWVAAGRAPAHRVVVVAVAATVGAAAAGLIAPAVFP